MYASTSATLTFAFSGSLNGNQIVGTLTETWTGTNQFGGTMSVPATLTKQ